MDTIILGIESSCDDTSAAVIKNGVLLSNVVSSQAVHEAYGGVVPELVPINKTLYRWCTKP
jgi:N6-L-threonylcarbamoyladenine synthase